MATRVELFTVTVPAGTTIAAPQITATRFDVGEVETVEILVPPGNAGLLGFAIMHSNASVLPREEDRWITAVGETIRWPTQDLPTAGAWAIRAYNLDVNPHSIYLRYLVRDDVALVPRLMPALPIAQSNQRAPVAEETHTLTQLPEVT